jgi:hypothetical protein
MEATEVRREPTVGESLCALEARVRAHQEATAREAARLLEGQARLSAGLAEQATAQAVLTQWMKDWTGEVAAWRRTVERRAEEEAAERSAARQEIAQARGAVRAALWAFGIALTVVTGTFTGVMVRVLGGLIAAGM